MRKEGGDLVPEESLTPEELEGVLEKTRLMRDHQAKVIRYAEYIDILRTMFREDYGSRAWNFPDDDQDTDKHRSQFNEILRKYRID